MEREDGIEKVQAATTVRDGRGRAVMAGRLTVEQEAGGSSPLSHPETLANTPNSARSSPGPQLHGPIRVPDPGY
jgi:hypothetical protein